jgi:hypothetical protein
VSTFLNALFVISSKRARYWPLTTERC